MKYCCLTSGFFCIYYTSNSFMQKQLSRYLKAELVKKMMVGWYWMFYIMYQFQHTSKDILLLFSIRYLGVLGSTTTDFVLIFAGFWVFFLTLFLSCYTGGRKKNVLHNSIFLFKIQLNCFISHFSQEVKFMSSSKPCWR